MHTAAPPPRAPGRIIVEIIQAIRATVPAGFCVGIKVNSVDVGSAADMGDCIQQLRAIAEAGIDFLEHGIGQAEKANTLAREAFFPGTPLLLTGGFRSRGRVQPALKEGVCDLVGLARPSVLDPMLPRTVLLNQDASDKDVVMYAKRIPGSTLTERLGVKLLGVGLERDWYTERLHWIGAIKTTIMVTGTAFPLGTAIVRSMLRRPDLVKNTYGLYATAHGAESRLREFLESNKHTHKILTLAYTELADVRKTAEGINRRVAIGSLPPIQALVLHEKDDVMPFLLSLLLLQSIDQDRGRIVVIGNRTRRMDALGSFTDKPAATKLSDTMLWCELSARLAVDPALSNISVAVVDQAWQPAHWFEQTLLAQILVWLVATVAILLRPDVPTSMTRRSAEDVARVLADDRNGVWVSGWVVSESDVDVKQWREAWCNYLVKAKVIQGDTTLTQWQ
ncbi:uncharacterized protein Aud_010235 [Aspergillus udagawae]|uniref:NADH oxidase n=1 Tax=Aspergillus udagawae TaxID=91492 RepID=A0A8E0V1L5_9EURO|nr:uncharacterized protein Aud_010235 [Aspergillus udagawae]GIC93747.1 hypothetical protein Aud_010235 [Aspergillus udagawae]